MPSVAESRKLVEIEATSLDEAGRGVGMSEEPSGPRTMHVPDLLPGERAEVAIDHQSPHKAEAWATIVRRLGEPSPARTSPACPAFGRCGGCAWQHLAYPGQLAEKRARVVRALAPVLGAGGVEAATAVAVAAVTPSPAELGYRHKGKYVAGWISGRLGLGAYAPRSHTLIDTAGCRVVAPLVDELRARACSAAAAAGLTPWVEKQRTGELRYVIVRATRDGRGLVVLVVRSIADETRVAAVARAIAGDPRVAGVLRMDNDRDDGALLDGAARVLAGDATVRDTVAGVAIELGAGEFAQVNPAQADAMYARVATLALEAWDATATRAADIYAGLGGITLALASARASVIAIERDPSAVAALSAAAAGAGLGDRVDARTGDAATLAHGGQLDVIVVNPPRKGLSTDVITALVASSARRVVYVSCGPESLARDLVLLRDGGFTIDTIEPFDLMPGTAQVETVVRLQR